MGAADIVNTLDKVWKIIDDNKPTAEIATARANAVPHVGDWTSLAGAQGPRETSWYAKMTNMLPESWGDIVVDFDLRLRFTYGATYHGGGRYITNVWVDISEVYVAWFHSLDLHLIAKDPDNAGTETAPLARIPITVSGKMTSPRTSIVLERGYMLYGDGRLDVL